MPNSVDPDRMPFFVVSGLDLLCLLKSVCSNYIG